MPSTHVSLHSHLVFSTNDRMPWIAPDWRERLHAYLGGIVKGLDGTPLAVGGLLITFIYLWGSSRRIVSITFLRDLKADSSEWIHREVGRVVFAWQKGYGAFSVSPSNIDTVRKYVLNQETHHQRYSFQEEYLRMLKSSGVSFDERYLW